MNVDEAILTRRSVRAFLPNPVPKATVLDILDVAARAPSGTNMQPWLVYAVAGRVRDAIVADAMALHDQGGEPSEYKYYPDRLFEPFIGRRRKVGWDLYGLVGIGKGDRERTHRQHGENYRFFGAPVGLFFFVHRELEIGSWLDYGMFIQNVMLAARGRGLHTCPQVAWTRAHTAVRPHVGAPDDHALICGMSLGYEDEAARVNSLRTERVPAAQFTTCFGFEEERALA
jgi:nitroreductase